MWTTGGSIHWRVFSNGADTLPALPNLWTWKVSIHWPLYRVPAEDHIVEWNFWSLYTMGEDVMSMVTTEPLPLCQPSQCTGNQCWKFCLSYNNNASGTLETLCGMINVYVMLCQGEKCTFWPHRSCIIIVDANNWRYFHHGRAFTMLHQKHTLFMFEFKSMLPVNKGLLWFLPRHHLAAHEPPSGLQWLSGDN